MKNTDLLPLYELSRGVTVESIHHGAIAVVDVNGKLLAHYGNPDTVTFLRSSAKPFQALPFFENGGQAFYQLSGAEVAVICASHTGTDQHKATVAEIQRRAGLTEADLMCGVHEPGDEATADALRERKESPTPLRHNCSGKHTGMLAYARMSGRSFPDLPYIDPRHPIQQEIILAFAEMCGMPVEQVATGVDGCSAPNFAVPLQRAAYAYARLSDPEAGEVLPAKRLEACRLITRSMMGNPEMVAGPGKFDTRLMEVTQGRVVSKGGAEGYSAIGLMPGAMGPGSPAAGITLKIADGDARGKIRSVATVEVLRQLGVLSSEELQALGEFNPEFEICNWRQILVGQGRPVFKL
jgi:L-asparaginase II